jgi:UDP-N-acetylglucosamine transferase subunit ALG13
MIFVTTGTQAPFNRLIKAMDVIAGTLDGERVVAQASGVDFDVHHMEVVDFLAPDDFNSLFSEARLIISHAGMGSIISALTYAKPILVVPRRVSLGEHRNDHQMSTAKKMEKMGYVPVVYETKKLKERIDLILHQIDNTSAHQLNGLASESLIHSLKEFILKK